MRTKASTLVEIIFYFTILGGLLLAAMSFAIQILNINSLSSNVHELNSNADLITQRIIYLIQTAESVNDAGCTFDDDNGVLSLNTTSSTTNYYLSDGDLYIQEASLDPVQLNTELTTYDYLRFSLIESDKTPDQITIDAQLSPSGKDLSNLQTTYPIQVSVSLRK